jgi:hypothetical protein
VVVAVVTVVLEDRVKLHRIAFPLSKLNCELYALEGELGPHSTQKASKLRSVTHQNI